MDSLAPNSPITHIRLCFCRCRLWTLMPEKFPPNTFLPIAAARTHSNKLPQPPYRPTAAGRYREGGVSCPSEPGRIIAWWGPGFVSTVESHTGGGKNREIVISHSWQGGAGCIPVPVQLSGMLTRWRLWGCLEGGLRRYSRFCGLWTRGGRFGLSSMNDTKCNSPSLKCRVWWLERRNWTKWHK